MIRSAMEYIRDLSAPMIVEIEGKRYSDKRLSKVVKDSLADPVRLATLEGLVDYISSHTDKPLTEKSLLVVESPTCVKLISALTEDRNRETMAVVEFDVPDFPFGRFTDHEAFCIGVQSKFIDNADKELLLRFAGTVESGTVSQYDDDGVTQKATIKQGVSSKAAAIVPGRVTLAPYRTFTEVEQPESEFIFRMADNNGVQCALFEADGRAWKKEAMKNIKEYLDSKIAASEYLNVKVIM